MFPWLLIPMSFVIWQLPWVYFIPLMRHLPARGAILLFIHLLFFVRHGGQTRLGGGICRFVGVVVGRGIDCAFLQIPLLRRLGLSDSIPPKTGSANIVHRTIDDASVSSSERAYPTLVRFTASTPA